MALDVNAIRRATQDDPTCQKLIELLQNNSWNSLNSNNLHPEINTAELRAYELLKQELSLTPEADLIIRENRLVIPTKLRQQVISLAHEGHQGLIKTKKLLREKVWFPKIDTLTEKAVKECLACQSVGQPSHNKRGTSFTLTFWDHCQQKTFCSLLSMAVLVIQRSNCN